jgi:hypothetical protein
MNLSLVFKEYKSTTTLFLCEKATTPVKTKNTDIQESKDLYMHRSLLT